MKSLYPDIDGLAMPGSPPDGKFDATAFVATALVIRALRASSLHYALSGAPCVIAIVGVSENDSEAVTEAASQLLKRVAEDRGGQKTFVYNCTIRPRQRSGTIDGMIEDMRIGSRLCCVYKAADQVPAGYRALSDGIAVLPPVDAALIRAACLEADLRVPSQKDLEALVELPLSLLEIALRRGSSISRGVALSQRIVAARLAEENEGKPAEILHDDAIPLPGPMLAELHGLGEVGEWGQSLAVDLAEYKAGRLSWNDVDRGALVSGPPGTGKTTFALALARTCEVPILIHSLARWQAAGNLDKLLKVMRAAFAQAKLSAPSILFVDELDSFGDRERMDDHNAYYCREVINGFLECLDGAEARTGVVVIGAANHPHLIDPAIRRAGRLDRHLVVPLPDSESRIGIFRYHLGCDLADCELRKVAAAADGMTGADIEQLVRSARRIARTARRPMGVDDLESTLPKTVRLSDELFRRVCVHEAGHVIVGIELARESGSVPVEAVVKREMRNSYGNQTRLNSMEGFDRSRRSYLAAVTTMMAGMAAEEVILGERGESSGGGPDSDLGAATMLLARMELSEGLGDTLLSVASFSPDELVRRLSGDPQARAAIETRLRDCLERSRTIIEQRRAEVDAVAHHLATNGRWHVPRPTPEIVRRSIFREAG